MKFFILRKIYDFLAVNSPDRSADFLVVEGWLPDYALEKAMQEFKKGSYRKLITTGLPLARGSYLSEYKTFAEVAAATLLALGFERDRLVAVPGPEALKDRTYTSAVAFREWLSPSNSDVKSINLYSFGPHSRRSWMLFKQALSPQIQVGVIAGEPLDYNPEVWWQFSEGVRTVISEAIAYVYARFFAHRT